MYAYCLFCETQHCGTIARIIERSFGMRCISPEIIQRKWVRGVCGEERHQWLPGYLFLFAEEPIAERFRLPGVIRWLGDGELRYEDLAFAMMIQEQNGVLGTVRLAEVGDRCVIDDPLWKDMEGTVTGVDRGRKRCCVEFMFDRMRRRVEVAFDGQQRSVWLGYEMVRTAKRKPWT